MITPRLTRMEWAALKELPRRWAVVWLASIRRHTRTSDAAERQRSTFGHRRPRVWAMDPPLAVSKKDGFRTDSKEAVQFSVDRKERLNHYWI